MSYIKTIIVLIILLGCSVFMLTNKPKRDVYKYTTSTNIGPEIYKEINSKIKGLYDKIYYINIVLFITLLVLLLIGTGQLYGIKVFTNSLSGYLTKYMLPIIIFGLSATLGVYGVLLGMIDTDPLVENFKTRLGKTKTKSVNIPADSLVRQNYVSSIPISIGCLGIIYISSHFYY